MESLPTDIVIELLIAVKNHASTGTLLACLLVNKQWYELSISLLYDHVFLYGNLALNKGNYGRFMHETKPEKYGARIRSLTFSLTAAHWQEWDFIKDCPNLTSVSYTVNIDPYPYKEEVMMTVKRLIKALPESCVNLELQTYPYGISHDPTYDVPHACKEIREILPRLRHCRISIQPICENILGERVGWEFRPVRTPYLRSLVIYCDRDSVYLDNYDGGEGPEYGWDTMLLALERLADNQKEELVKNEARVHAVYRVREHFRDRRKWLTWFRVDVINRMTWAFPYADLGYRGQRLIFLALPDNKRIIAEEQDTRAAVEGRTWRTVQGDMRIPWEVLEKARMGHRSFATNCSEAPFLAEDPTELEGAWDPICLRKNEELAGMQLLHAERREGLFRQDEMRPVVEITPPGFKRRRYEGNYGVLLRRNRDKAQ